ncbi:MAG: ribonuclease HI [Spirochaetia bacterium]
MRNIRIYTDGGCSGNPGPGAWAYILLEGEGSSQGSRFVQQTTNNRMELQAVIEALQKVHETSVWYSLEIEVFTDSQYVKNGISDWIHTWVRNGWRTRSKKPVRNQDLWQELMRLTTPLKIRWHWLQGHAGDPYNEACDRLVREAIQQGRK